MEGLWDFLTESIIIVGPAIVAAVGALRTAASQTNARIREFEEKHRFEARSHLFNYYRAHLDQKHQSSEKVGENLGKLIGIFAGDSVIPDEDLEVFFNLGTNLAKEAPIELAIGLQQLSEINLEKSLTYEALKNCENIANWDASVNDKKTLIERLIALQQLYRRITAAELVRARHEIEQVLTTYADVKKDTTQKAI